jgi:hypothetical protein
MRTAAFSLVVAIGFALTGTANAGVITATYDLTGSTLTTTTTVTPADTDQITGTVTMQFGAASINGPISWAALVGGTITNTIINPDVQPGGGFLTLNGVTTTTITAPGSGGTIGVATIALNGAPATVTRSLLCSGSLCGFAFPVNPQTIFPPTSVALATVGGIPFTSGQAGLGN